MTEQESPLDVDADAFGHAEWSEALRDGVLVGTACEDCGHVVATPKAACPACGSRSLALERLSTEGTVHTETTIGVPPEGFEERGYTVAVVTVDETRIMARIDDDIDIGDSVALDGVTEGDDPAPIFTHIDT